MPGMTEPVSARSTPPGYNSVVSGAPVCPIVVDGAPSAEPTGRAANATPTNSNTRRTRAPHRKRSIRQTPGLDPTTTSVLPLELNPRGYESRQSRGLRASPKGRMTGPSAADAFVIARRVRAPRPGAKFVEGERRDSNPRPPGPQPGALPAELRPPGRSESRRVRPTVIGLWRSATSRSRGRPSTPTTAGTRRLCSHSSPTTSRSSARRTCPTAARSAAAPATSNGRAMGGGVGRVPRRGARRRVGR